VDEFCGEWQSKPPLFAEIAQFFEWYCQAKWQPRRRSGEPASPAPAHYFPRSLVIYQFPKRAQRQAQCTCWAKTVKNFHNTTLRGKPYHKKDNPQLLGRPPI